MKRFVITFLVILFSSLIFAQTDPAWLWAKWGGSVNVDNGRGIARDSAGNIYVTGWVNGNAEFGDLSLINPDPGNCAFVAKLDTEGNWIWVRKGGGSGNGGANGYAIACDNDGNCTVVGEFSGTVTFGGSTITTTQSVGIFAAKIDNTGLWLWAVSASGNEYGDDKAYGVAIGEMGNSYITGFFKGTAIFGMDVLASNSGDDGAAFVAKIDAGGNWIWAKKAGGTSWTNQACGNGIAANNNGEVFVTGYFTGTIEFGDATLVSIGDSDIFAAGISSTGNWTWAKRAGSNDIDSGFAISCDNMGNCYLTGIFNFTADFGTNSLTATSGQTDIFITKISNLHDWVWAKKIAGSGADHGRGIASDENGNIYVTGNFIDNATLGTITLTSSNMYASDAFAAKLDTDGEWLWALRAGGAGEDFGFAITCDNNGNSFVAGMTTGNADFGATILTGTGSQDVFTAKLTSGEVYNDDETNHSISDIAGCMFAYPNPCRTSETLQIKLNITNREKGTLNIYNVLGQSVAKYSIESENQSISIDSKSLSSGIYFYNLKTNSINATKRLVIIR